MLTFKWSPNATTRAEGLARFQRTGGAPPAGVTLLGRWTRADLSGGYDLLETDDPGKLVEFAYGWSDLMQLDTVPVLEDQALAQALQRAMT